LRVVSVKWIGWKSLVWKGFDGAVPSEEWEVLFCAWHDNNWIDAEAEEVAMGLYVVTDRADLTWDDDHKYKYRHESADGSAVAQDEVERRREAGQPVFLWRWENGQPTLVEQHNV
jgi:hypothetical protein